MNFLARKGQKVYSERLLTDLTVASRYDIGEKIGDETLILLSQDGKGYVTEWATEPSSAEVYIEVHSSVRGLTFHGWVDEDSRRIVQAG